MPVGALVSFEGYDGRMKPSLLGKMEMAQTPHASLRAWVYLSASSSLAASLRHAFRVLQLRFKWDAADVLLGRVVNQLGSMAKPLVDITKLGPPGSGVLLS